MIVATDAIAVVAVTVVIVEDVVIARFINHVSFSIDLMLNNKKEKKEDFIARVHTLNDAKMKSKTNSFCFFSCLSGVSRANFLFSIRSIN